MWCQSIVTKSFMGSELNTSDIFWLPQFLKQCICGADIQSHLWNYDATSVSPWFDDDINLFGAIAVKCDEIVYFKMYVTPIIQFVEYISSILQTWQNDWIWRLFMFWFHQKYFTTIYVWAVMNAYNRVNFEFLVAIRASLSSATTCHERPYLLGPLGGHYIQVLLYMLVLVKQINFREMVMMAPFPKF